MKRRTHSKRHPFHGILGALGLALLAAGCGGGGADSQAGSEPDPAAAESSAPDLCALLTSADIEEALGQAPGASEAGDEDLGQCTWSAADGSSELVVLTLDRAVLDSFDDFVVNFGEEFGGEDPPRDEYHPVEGVPGEWAMYVAEEHMVRAFRGDHVLEVSAESAEEDEVVDLATRAMGRLP